MKKKICLYCAVASILCNLTGCTLKDKISNQIENAIEVIYGGRDNVAYISIWNEFFEPVSMEYNSDGKAYSNYVNRNVWVDDAFWDGRLKLTFTNTIYINSGTFTQFFNDDYKRSSYSGTYKVKDNELLLDYQYYNFYIGGIDEEYYLDMKNKKTNMAEGSRIYTYLVDNMNVANDYDYALEVGVLFNRLDKLVYMSSPHYFNCRVETGNWNRKFNSIDDMPLRLYLKDDFLVTEQKGYAFDGNISNKEFTLKYDDTDLDIDNSCQFKMTFNSDNTWENDYNSGYNGTWKLIYDNLLVIYPPEDDSYYNDFNISLLYLDFDKEEIYVPAYIRCDDMIHYLK